MGSFPLKISRCETSKLAYHLFPSANIPGKSEIQPAIEELKQLLNEKRDKMKNISINASCGNHIHFSFKKRGQKVKHFYQKIPREYLVKLRNKVRNRVKTELPEIYPHYKKQYFRSFAKSQPTGRDYFLFDSCGTRYYEFNPTA